jgi:hypothetical protein
MGPGFRQDDGVAASEFEHQAASRVMTTES